MHGESGRSGLALPVVRLGVTALQILLAETRTNPRTPVRQVVLNKIRAFKMPAPAKSLGPPSEPLMRDLVVKPMTRLTVNLRSS